MQQHFVIYYFYSIQWICFVYAFLLRLPSPRKTISMSILRLCRVSTGKDVFCCTFGATNPEVEKSSYVSHERKIKFRELTHTTCMQTRQALFCFVYPSIGRKATRTLVESKTSEHKVVFLEKKNCRYTQTHWKRMMCCMFWFLCALPKFFSLCNRNVCVCVATSALQ